MLLILVSLFPCLLGGLLPSGENHGEPADSVDPADSYRVEATIDLRAPRIRGRVRTDFPGTGRAFWIYPNRLAEPPPQLSDINKFRVFLRGFQAGELRLDHVTCGDVPVQVTWETVAGVKRAKLILHKADPGTCPLEIAFTVRIPRRFGPFGCIMGRCTLGAPWYPVPVDPEKPSDVPVFPHRVKVTAGGGAPGEAREFFLHGVMQGKGETSGTAPFFPLFWSQDGSSGFTCRPPVCMLHQSPLSGAFDFLTGNRTGDVLELAAGFVRDAFPELDQTLVLVETPLREELAMALPGRVMLVSDQALRIVNHKYFQSFHRQKIKLTLAETLFLDRMTPGENPDDLAFVPLLHAHALLQLSDVDHLLEFFEWIPQIDVMRKNPRMGFRHAYLPGPHNKDLFRDDFRRWNNSKPRGEEVYHRLLDWIGEVELPGLLEKMRDAGRPFRRELSRHLGQDMSWFFERWVDADPSVAIRIDRVRRLPRQGGRHVYEITIVREPALRTPVVLELVPESGGAQRVNVDLVQDRTPVRVELDSPLVRAVLDPDGRVLEPQGTGALYPQYDNVWPDPGWRFMFSGFEAMFNVTELWSRLLVDVDFMPRHSLRRRWNIMFIRNEYFNAGLNLGHLLYFGPRISNSRLAFRLDTGVESARTRPVTHEDTELPIQAWSHSAFVRLVHNNRPDHIFPTTGGWGMLEAKASWFVPDATGADDSHLFRVIGQYNKYFPLPWGLSAALQGAGGFLWGTVHHDSELLALTGPGRVQGYAMTRFPGRAYALTAGEVRHILVPGLNLTLAGLVNVTRISTALYAGAGIVAGTRDGSWSEDLRTAAGAGAALRIHGLWLGLYEAVLNLQVGFPLIRQVPGLEPYIFFISLEPTI